MHISSRIPAALLLAAALGPAQADEGMWTYNNFSADKVEKAYGFKPDQRWLDHLRLSSLKVASGCSAAFVSPRGLVQTNHHCARACIQQLSTAERDFMADGFYAREAKDELKCPDMELQQLIEISDVTARVKAATAGKDGAAYSKALNAAEAAIARECTGNDDGIRCDVVDLYSGATLHLYKYRRFQDVRLVFAVESAIANFGGDPDNFQFPRYQLDIAYVRVYRDGAPLDSSAHYLRYAASDAKAGELTLTSGHPGWTARHETVAGLEYLRDFYLARTIFQEAELRGVLTEFSARGAEEARIAGDLLLTIENSLKVRKGEFAALTESTIIRDRAADEQALRRKVEADRALRAQYGALWDKLAASYGHFRGVWNFDSYTEWGFGFRSQLFEQAKTLVRYAAEGGKPDEERLPGYNENDLPTLRQTLLSPAPIYPRLEKLTLAFSLTKLREVLGPDDPFVRKVLGARSPEQLAAYLVDGTGLGNVDLRRSLLEGGPAAIEASTDPMIVLLRMIDPEMRAARRANVERYDATERLYQELAELKLKAYGAATAPDATGTLRISYGAVAGYRKNGRPVEPMTIIAGIFERATGEEPFKLPQRWLAARAQLNSQLPFNFVTTNDAVGGNSGSPVVNKAGEVVGLYFDNNWESLGGTYGYDGTDSRGISVNVGVIREALAKVYRADRIVQELAE